MYDGHRITIRHACAAGRAGPQQTRSGILGWRVTPLTGGASKAAGLNTGVFRVEGIARRDGDLLPWSLILKALATSDAPSVRDPASWNYWKREALAFQSGLLEDLPGSLSAPHCYAVQELDEVQVWLWLEDIGESVATWTVADHRDDQE